MLSLFHNPSRRTKVETLKHPFPPEIASLMTRIRSKKRTVFVSRDINCKEVKLRSYWDGGSKTSFIVIRNGAVWYPPVSGSAFEKEAEAYIPHVGDVLIQYGTFNGKEAIPHFTFYGVESAQFHLNRWRDCLLLLHSNPLEVRQRMETGFHEVQSHDLDTARCYRVLSQSESHSLPSIPDAREMRQTLFIVRGLPGSGKSTIARQCVADGNGMVAHVEADMWFERSGTYKYEKEELPNAHKWCQDECLRLLKEGKTVIVSNTFTRKWEMKPYIRMAEAMGIPRHYYNCTGNYESIHNVPADAMDRMRARWEE
jgi:hypothetical protein